ncbi:MAG: hypothetical protein IPK35_04555 [Saprospiraceae bacterium]|jgi:hypothetical protein|nr:hypothetical protein [Saprospiraceae bacterium]
MRSFDSVKSLRQQINLYLDNELSAEDQKTFITQVESDPKSTRILNSEKDFREFVRNNVKRPSVTPDFIRDLKNRIR